MNMMHKDMPEVLKKDWKQLVNQGIIDPEANVIKEEFTNQITKCPVCLSTTILPPFTSIKLNSFSECSNCGSVFRNPRWSDAVLKMFLSDCETLDSKIESAIRRFKRNIVSGAELIKLLDIIEECHNGSVKCYVDIGSRIGDIVYLAKQRGWESWAVEPSVKGCEFMLRQGLNVKNGLFSANLFEAGYFDAVSFRNVVTNLPEPRSFFREVNRSLNMGGVCLFQDFSSDSFAFRLLKPMHLSLYGWDSCTILSREGIRILLEENGFSLLFYKTYKPDISLADVLAKVLHLDCYHRFNRLHFSAFTNKVIGYLDRIVINTLLGWYLRKKDLCSYYTVVAEKINEI